MMMVAFKRLQEQFPNAEIVALTRNSGLFQELFPAVTPIDMSEWPRNFLRSSLPQLPIPLTSRLQVSLRTLLAFEERRTTWIDGLLQRFFSYVDPEHQRAYQSFIRLIESADLVVVSGQGSINDHFHFGTRQLLRTLLLASSRGCKIGMLGQGLGPLKDPGLRHLAMALFPRLDFLALREPIYSHALAQALDAPKAATFLTGYDALEMAYRARPPSLGDNLGVNLRVASYSNISDKDEKIIGSSVRDFVNRKRICPVAIPISRFKDEDDLDSISRLVPNVVVPQQIRSDTTPDSVIAEIGKCRLVVTGSYHAAVFALGQGVPTIGIAATDYYRQKFEGLRALFGQCIRTVSLSDSTQGDEISNALEKMWAVAEGFRSQALASAAAQCRASLDFFQQIPSLLGSVPAQPRNAEYRLITLPTNRCA